MVSSMAGCWLTRCRLLDVRYEQRADTGSALHHLATAMIGCRFVERWSCWALWAKPVTDWGRWSGFALTGVYSRFTAVPGRDSDVSVAMR